MPLTPPPEQPNNPYLPGLPGINTAGQRKDIPAVQTAPHIQARRLSANFGTAPIENETPKAQPPNQTHPPWLEMDASSDYKNEPVYTFCGCCKNNVMTFVRYKVGKLTIMIAGFMCLVGCVAGCCLVPFVLRKTRDVIHACPNCKMELGRFKRKL